MIARAPGRQGATGISLPAPWSPWCLGDELRGGGSRAKTVEEDAGRGDRDQGGAEAVQGSFGLVQGSTCVVQESFELDQGSSELVQGGFGPDQGSFEPDRGRIGLVQGSFEPVQGSLELDRLSLELVQDGSELVQGSTDLDQESIELVQDSFDLVQESIELDQGSSELVQESLEPVQESLERVQDGFERDEIVPSRDDVRSWSRASRLTRVMSSITASTHFANAVRQKRTRRRGSKSLVRAVNPMKPQDNLRSSHASPSSPRSRHEACDEGSSNAATRPREERNPNAGDGHEHRTLRDQQG